MRLTRRCARVSRSRCRRRPATSACAMSSLLSCQRLTAQRRVAAGRRSLSRAALAPSRGWQRLTSRVRRPGWLFRRPCRCRATAKRARRRTDGSSTATGQRAVPAVVATAASPTAPSRVVVSSMVRRRAAPPATAVPTQAPVCLHRHDRATPSPVCRTPWQSATGLRAVHCAEAPALAM